MENDDFYNLVYPATIWIGVYLIQDVMTGGVYIGSSKDIWNRLSTHRWLLRKGRHYATKLQEAFDAKRILKIKIYLTDDREEAYQLEQKLIVENQQVFNTATNVKSPRKGAVISQSTRDKLSRAITGKRLSTFGKRRGPRALESVAKQKASMAANSRRVSIQGIEYPNVNAASKALGVTYTTISNRARSKTVTFKDWFYVD